MPWGRLIDSEILAIHAALIPTTNGGEILYFGGDQHSLVNNIDHDIHPTQVDASRLFSCRVDASGRHAIEYVKSPPADVFCAGHAFLPDGRLLICGGTEFFAIHAVGPPGHGLLLHSPGLRECWMYEPRSRRFTQVASLHPQYDGRHLVPGAPVTPVFEQSPGVFAALTIDTFGAMNVTWLDVHDQPLRWRGPIAFGSPVLVAGAPITPVFEQAPGVFAALTVDRSGTMNVVWLDTNGELGWQGPVPFGGRDLFPGAAVSPVFEQTPGVFAALTIGRSGAMNVVWLNTHSSPIGWEGPVGFGSTLLVPGAPVTPVFEQSPGVFAALAVDQLGAMNVVWLDTNGPRVGWQGPTAFGGRDLVPGAAVSAAFEQTPGVYAALTIGKAGRMHVAWLDTNVPHGGWRGPAGFGGAHLVPGGAISRIFAQTPGVFAVLTVDRHGAMNVIWLNTHAQNMGWEGPAPIGGRDLVPGAPVTRIIEQTPGVFAALTIGRSGSMSVVWLNRQGNPIGWEGPAEFGERHLLAGGFVSDAVEQRPGVFAALAIDSIGAMNVAWLDTHQAPMRWEGPVAYGALGGGRWYPTLVTLPSGDVFAYGGHPRNEDTRHNLGHAERYSASANAWTLLPPTAGSAAGNPDLYPRLFLLPNGRVFCASPLKGFSRCVMFDANTGTATETVPLPDAPFYTDFEGFATSAVLLPLLPEDGYRPRVLVCGGSIAQRVNLAPAAGAMPAWQTAGIRHGSAAGKERIHGCALLLPTGQVLMTGGVRDPRGNQDVADVGVDQPEIYTPAIDWASDTYRDVLNPRDASDRWDTIEEPSPVIRNYHSTALLMPDGRVWTAGSSTDALEGPPQERGVLEIAIFSPPYPAGARPRIVKAPRAVGYSQPFEIDTPDAPTIDRIALLRCGSVTHAFDSDQRYIGLSFETIGRSRLRAQSPPTPEVAPPGQYMVFLVDRAGRPCEYAHFLRVGSVGWRGPVAFGGRHLVAGAPVTPVFEQSRGIFAALTVDSLGAMNVVWLDANVLGMGWKGPVAFGGRDLAPGAPVSPAFAQTPGVFAALTVGRGAAMNVAWLNTHAEPMHWEGPAGFGGDHLVAGAPMSPAFEQAAGVFAALTIDRLGAMNVAWLNTRHRPLGWEGPVAFGGRELAPAGHVSPVFEQSQGVFAALTVGKHGAMSVVWLDTHAEPVAWNGPAAFGGRHLVPGAPVTPVFEQTEGVFAALTVDSLGALNVVWLNMHVQRPGWQGPVAFGGQHLAPGANVTPVFEQAPGVLTALTIDQNGSMNVAWLNTNEAPVTWRGPIAFGGRHLVPGGRISPVFAQAAGVFAALTVDKHGAMNVAWLDTHAEPIIWKGPIAFGGQHLAPGASISSVFEQSPGVFAALTIDRHGAMNVVWLDTN
jgi:hypothetical protein